MSSSSSALRILHRGWTCSPYTAKTRSYLKYKNIGFEDIESPLTTLFFTVRKNVGKPIMPTVEIIQGHGAKTKSVWLQDSSAIIDHFETDTAFKESKSIHDRRLLFPTSGQHKEDEEEEEGGNIKETAVIRVASALLELFGDEFLVAAALHYRWGRGETAYNFALTEFARCGLPFLPDKIGRMVVSPVGAKMRGYMPIMGINSETAKGIEKTVDTLLSAIEDQLGATNAAYLFGERPCIGDFALYGQLYAHLWRDGGAPDLWDHRPNVLSWMDRLTSGSTKSVVGSNKSSKTSATTASYSISKLSPIFKIILEDALPFSREVVKRIDNYCDANPHATRLPRSLGAIKITYGGIPATRKMATFHQWKVQRVFDTYKALGAEGKSAVDAWLEGLQGNGGDVIKGSDVIPIIKNPIGRTEAFREILANRRKI